MEDVVWIKPDTKGYKIAGSGRQHSLILMDVGTEYTGTYTCIATNRAGQSICTARLEVDEGETQGRRIHLLFINVGLISYQVLVQRRIHEFIENIRIFYFILMLWKCLKIRDTRIRLYSALLIFYFISFQHQDQSQRPKSQSRFLRNISNVALHIPKKFKINRSIRQTKYCICLRRVLGITVSPPEEVAKGKGELSHRRHT